MFSRTWIVSGAVLGALSVALGAFGAHGLPARLEQAGWSKVEQREEFERRLANYETAARYQMYHAVALVLVGLLAHQRRSKALAAAGCCFLAGVAIFSGLLYVLVFTGPELRWLGAVVPIGGTLLIAGWVLLAIGGAAQGEHAA